VDGGCSVSVCAEQAGRWRTLAISHKHYLRGKTKREGKESERGVGSRKSAREQESKRSAREHESKRS
jgi:hypothetical protein